MLYSLTTATQHPNEQICSTNLTERIAPMSNPSSQRRPPATSSIKPAGRGGDLFIVDNSDTDWKVRSYLSDWCELSSAIDIATGYFEISALLGMQEKCQTVDHILPK